MPQTPIVPRRESSPDQRCARCSQVDEAVEVVDDLSLRHREVAETSKTYLTASAAGHLDWAFSEVVWEACGIAISGS